MKPRLFIGSSSEKVQVANAVHEALERDLEVTVWNQGVIKLSASALDSLIEALDSSDYGVFVFTPDDLSLIRGDERPVARDNVVFELGLFLGRLGRGRSFVLLPRGGDLRLPSDIVGFTPAEYDAGRRDGNLTAAVGPACNKIRESVQRTEKKVSAWGKLNGDWVRRRPFTASCSRCERGHVEGSPARV